MSASKEVIRRVWTASPRPRTEVAKPASRPYAKSYSIAQTCSLKMIQSRHMPIGKELEANLGDAVGLFDYWRVLKTVRQ